ncbi:tRNA 2-selenouridine(34) synthase MnmH [Synechococcus sp. CS-1328]|uniref:tRNA 2-selenouridine(34) synthase MnmH n=1 Tax=Synechococcus sp. CS-1328 TaxID=2847976 RepID=UPI00223B8C5E|nr:tRNA 2-selenouridine(34) synthase MnmH [Synechococcus sp. CS-1328]MCT0226255.1 tRNA 2-selenouridine(34) synthase MnmH [Synechococcus sp. CS-1328]
MSLRDNRSVALDPTVLPGIASNPVGPAALPVSAFLAASGPVVDVRSPGEFRQGHIPGACSLPLFSDEERAEIGTLYKQEGRPSAVRRGLELVGPRLVDLGDRLSELASADCSGAGQVSDLRLHCWRGGMRSASVAWLASTLDLPVVLLEGGYKAFRRWVLQSFEQPWPLQLLGGRTGCGKTDLLEAMAARGLAVIDLEGLAHHRGSSFGGLGQPEQPSSEHFENRLALALLHQRNANAIWVEAESAQVGRCRIPRAFWQQMVQAPVLEIQRSEPERIERLVAVYGRQDPDGLRQATERIARRLGPQRTDTALKAIAAQNWASACKAMLDYYDRCYDHELDRHPAPSLGRLDLSGLSDTAAAIRLERHLLGAEPVPA